MTTQPAVQPARFARSLSLISLAALLIFVTALLTLMNRPPNFGSFGGQSPLIAQATTIPSPTIAPVATNIATAAPTPIMYSDYNVTPVPDTSAIQFMGLQPITFNQSITEQLTIVHSRNYYAISVPQDGLLELVVDSFDFKPRIQVYQLDSHPIVMSDGGTSKTSEETVYIHAHKGNHIGIIVSGDTKANLGTFTLFARLRQPIVLVDSTPVKEQQLTFETGQINPNRQIYYSFDAKAGDVLDLRVKSDGRDDYNLYLQGYDPDYVNVPIFHTTLGSKCDSGSAFQQCFDDDSGGDTDPELHGILVQRDMHFEAIVSAWGVAQSVSNYQITLTRTLPSSILAGTTVYTFLSWKTPAVPFAIDARKDDVIRLSLSRNVGAKYSIYLTATQNGKDLGSEINTDSQPTSMTFTSLTNDPVVLFVSYGYFPSEGDFTGFSLANVSQ